MKTFLSGLTAIVCVLSVVCCEQPAGDSSPPAGDTAPKEKTPDFLSEFKRQHGVEYDPLSRVSREKMAKITGAGEKPGGSGAKGIPEAKQPVPAPVPLSPRPAIIAEATKLLGNTETHGSNRSPLIDAMNRLTGVPMGSPYCASFNAYVYQEAGVPAGKFPRSAWSPDWVKNPTWTRSRNGRNPLPGDAFGIWFANRNRIAHTGLVERWGDSVLTLEGNTGPTGTVGEFDRNGDGIYRKRRARGTIHSVRNWLD